MKSLWTQHPSMTCPTYSQCLSYHSSPVILFPELLSFVDCLFTGVIPSTNCSVSLRWLALLPLKRQNFIQWYSLNPPLSMIPRVFFCLFVLYSWLFTSSVYSLFSIFWVFTVLNSSLIVQVAVASYSCNTKTEPVPHNLLLKRCC